MVRINLIDPHALADQHLIAEYREILLLAGYIRRFPSTADLPSAYSLGKGHMRFFKDKMLYLKERHERIRGEMRRRGFNPRIEMDVSGYAEANRGNWEPGRRDVKLLKERILERIRKKSDFYRYYGQQKPLAFWKRLMRSAEA